MSPRPPAVGRWLLRLGLPDGLIAEAIAGDLAQEYNGRQRWARLWYLRQVSGVVLRSGRDRIRGRSWFGRPGAASRFGSGTHGGDPGRRPGDRARRLEGLLHDVRFGARTLVRRPMFALVAIGTLALGMGVNTAIFSVVNALFLRPIPAIQEPSTLVEIMRGEGSEFIDVAWSEFDNIRTASATLDDVAAWMGNTVSLRDRGVGEAAVYRGREVSGNYFSVLGVEPAFGRFFAPHESFWPDIADEAVISHRLWRERYGGADVIGRQAVVNGYPVTIIGVAPEGFTDHQILVQRDVFVPIGLPAPGLIGAGDLSSGSGFVVLLGRIADGENLTTVRQELAGLGERFYADAGMDEPHRLRAEAYGGIPGTDRAMVAMFFAGLLLITGMVMAIACVNVANMLLARATVATMLLARGLERRREIAIRMSLGAGRGRVARQLLTESALLFVVAAAASLVATAWITDLLVRWYLPSTLSTLLSLDVSPDWRVLSFSLGSAAAAGIAFGMAPAFAAAPAAGGWGARARSAHMQRSRLGGVLVGAQMALALMLLVAAGLTTRTLAALETIDLGYDVDGVYSVELDLDLAGYDSDRSRLFYDRLLERVRAVPGIAAAATARKLPMDSRSVLTGVRPRDGDAAPEDGYRVHFNRVSPGYFDTLGIALLEGRDLDAGDGAEGPLVAVVNATLASRFWASGSVVGERFSIGSGADLRTYEVVGVAADARYHDFVEETPNFIYVAAAQSPDSIGHVLIRSQDLAGTVGAVRAAVAEIDPDVPVVDVRTVREIVNGFSMGQRLAAGVAAVVGFVGLLLGAVGVYGVTAFAVGRRTHEIGVRLALGADAGDVRRLMLRSGLRAPLIGMAVGLVTAAAIVRLAGSLLFDIGSGDPAVWLGVVVILGSVAVGAILLPVRRAAALDPVNTLRSE